VSGIDIVLVGAAFLLVFLLGGWFSRRQGDSREFFLGSRSIAWPLACFSLVATETSGITFLGVPEMSYRGSWVFLQMALGYIAGRALVAWLLVPAIRKGDVTSIYEYIRTRLGARSGALTACVFLLTRLLADGVRLFITAVPLQLATGIPFAWSVLIIVIVTAAYSLMGGIRGIVWLDTIQLGIYLLGAVISIYVIAEKLPQGLGTALEGIASEGKLRVFDFAFDLSRYTFWAGLFGGAAFSVASHGTDHLMAQRYLLVPTDRDARKVVVGSGVVVFLQFALFLFLGSCLFCLWPERTFENRNEVFAAFIVEELPPGVRGLVLSSVFAAAMSTLSSSINALAASTVHDIGRGLFGIGKERAESVGLARVVSLLWAAALGAAAFLVSMADRNVVDLALGIASITYGGVLGIFLLSRFTRSSGKAAVAGFLCGTGFSAYLFFFPLPLVGKVFWPWLVPLGAAVTVLAAFLSRRLPGVTTRRSRPEAP